MYINIIAHNSKKSKSSSSVFQYLDKENTKKKLKNQILFLEGKEEEISPNSIENFFNQEYNPYDLNNKNSMIDPYEASEQIDKNRGKQSLNLSNFYILNLNPSQKEQEHLVTISKQVLESKGLIEEECSRDVLMQEYYKDQLDQVLKIQMKLYAKNVMDEYAKQMNREIYANQNQLPNNAERKKMKPEIEKRYQNFLIEKGLKEKQFDKYILLEYTNKSKTEIEGVNSYTFKYENEEYTIFSSHNKVREYSERVLAIDKDFLENKIQEQEDKDKGIKTNEKTILKVKIDNEIKSSTMISLKVNQYDEEIKLWLNNKDFVKKGKDKIEVNKYKIEKLISNAIERDIKQKEWIEIDYKNLEIKDIKNKDEKLFVFSKNIKGLQESICITFKENEIKKENNKYFARRYMFDYREEKAKEKVINQEYGEIKEKIKNQVWQENGFDTTKRKLEGKDLLYFGKVETQRTYKHTDKMVLRNREILKKIKEYERSLNPLKKYKIESLKKSLHRDKYTGQIINEGVKKGGLNYHIHIVVSRHDKTSINPKDKVSISPISNQRGGKLHNGAKVGFDRDYFFSKAEQIFDKQFGYIRLNNEKYQNFKRNKELTTIKQETKDLLKQGVENVLGINEVKEELNVFEKAKREIMPIPIPTSLPKSKIDLIIKLFKLMKSISMDKGIGY